MVCPINVPQKQQATNNNINSYDAYFAQPMTTPSSSMPPSSQSIHVVVPLQPSRVQRVQQKIHIVGETVIYMFPNSESIEGTLLAAFYYGYTISQVPGGWLASRYGSKSVLSIAVLIWSIATYCNIYIL